MRSGGRVWATLNEPKSHHTVDVYAVYTLHVQYIIIIILSCSAFGCFLYIFWTNVYYSTTLWCDYLSPHVVYGIILAYLFVKSNGNLGYGGGLFSRDLPPCWIIYSNNQKYSNIMAHKGDRRLQPTIADASEQAQIPEPPVGVHY